jgi:hypothetical protein
VQVVGGAGRMVPDVTHDVLDRSRILRAWEPIPPVPCPGRFGGAGLFSLSGTAYSAEQPVKVQRIDGARRAIEHGTNEPP